MRFLESVTKSGVPVLINIERVCAVMPGEEGEGTFFVFNTDGEGDTGIEIRAPYHDVRSELHTITVDLARFARAREVR